MLFRVVEIATPSMLPCVVGPRVPVPWVASCVHVYDAQGFVGAFTAVDGIVDTGRAAAFYLLQQYYPREQIRRLKQLTDASGKMHEAYLHSLYDILLSRRNPRLGSTVSQRVNEWINTHIWVESVLAEGEQRTLGSRKSEHF